MIALVLQLAGLIGLPIGGALVAGPGGVVVGASLSVIYVGVAIDRAGD
jgi:hypothetical protein